MVKKTIAQEINTQQNFINFGDLDFAEGQI